MLARNDDIEGAIHTIDSIESHFNKWFHYPYILLNDLPFNDTFINRIEKAASGNVQHGTIPPNMWGFPSGMDQARAKASMRMQGNRGVKYGDVESYHHMCRFFAGYVGHNGSWVGSDSIVVNFSITIS